MLEKYRKQAHDAHLNGDRVTSEYYLQFADHYFRVIADTRVRQEEARARRDERWQEGDAPYVEADDSADFSVESDFPAFDQPPVYQKREREDRPAREERGPREDRPVREERAPREDRPVREERAPREERPVREERGPREDRPMREERPARRDEPVPVVAAQDSAALGEGEGQRNPYEPPENPFLRDNRGSRGLRPRRDDRRPEPRAPRRDYAPLTAEAPEPRESEVASVALEASLPPSISTRRKAAAPAPAPAPMAVAEEAPRAPKRRAPRRKPVSDTGEALEPTS